MIIDTEARLMKTDREKFEAWITSPPVERSTFRWPVDDEKYACPGQYQDRSVQLAWEAWEQTFRLSDPQR